MDQRYKVAFVTAAGNAIEMPARKMHFYIFALFISEPFFADFFFASPASAVVRDKLA